MGDVVSVNDVVIPVSLSRLECSALKSECSLPRTGFRGSLVLGKRKLARVVVPRAEEVNGLDAGGSAQIE